MAKIQKPVTAPNFYGANPVGIGSCPQLVPDGIGSSPNLAQQELTNPKVWILAPLPCKFSLNHKRLQIRTDTTLDHPVTWSAALQLTDMMYNYGNMLHPALPLISNLVAQIEIRSQRNKLKIGAAGTVNCRALLAMSL